MTLAQLLNLDDLQILPILWATLGAMAFGFLWYARPVFGKAWMQMTGVTPEQAKRGAGPAMGGMLVLAIVTSFGVELVLNAWRSGEPGGRADSLLSWTQGAEIGAMLGLCFSFTAVAGGILFEMRPKKLLLVTGGYQVLSGALMGAIIAATSKMG